MLKKVQKYLSDPILLFTRKKFPIPLTLTVSGNKMLYGINTPQVDLMEVELRLYF